MDPGVFKIPYELRLLIYERLFSQDMYLDLCTQKAEQRIINISKKQIVSPLANFISQRRLPRTWAREHGIHLLDTSLAFREELLPLLAKITLTIHCPTCLRDLLHHLKVDLHVSDPPFRTIRYQVKPIDDGDHQRESTYERVISQLESMKSAVTDVYGFRMHRPARAVDELREWSIDVHRTIALLTMPLRDMDERNLVVGDSYRRLDANDFRVSKKTVLEVKVRETDDVEGLDKSKVLAFLTGQDVRIAPDDEEWWRMSCRRKIVEKYGEDRYRMRLRDEVWIVLRFL